MSVLFIIYLIVGYWAVGVVLYENKVVIHTFGTFFYLEAVFSCIFGRDSNSDCNIEKNILQMIGDKR